MTESCEPRPGAVVTCPSGTLGTLRSVRHDPATGEILSLVVHFGEVETLSAEY